MAPSAMMLRKLLLLSSSFGLIALACGETTLKIVEIEDEDAGTSTDTTMPPSSSGSSGTSGSSGKSSSGSSGTSGSSGSSGKDAGPTAPAAGDACTKINEVFEKVCGKCGKHSAICLADGAGGKVSEYGACQNEIGQC